MTRIRITLAVLVIAAIAGTGVLTNAAAWPASPTTGLIVAAASIITITGAALALRILVVLTRTEPAPLTIPVRVDDRPMRRR